MADFEPLRIVGIVEELVGKPRNDGTPGSRLYAVPFRLSARPPAQWAEYFPHVWDHPAKFTSSHRPGICRVSGDIVWLDRTTVEEVQGTHKETLQLALEETNRKYAEWAVQQGFNEQKKQEQEEAHRQAVSEAVKKIQFD